MTSAALCKSRTMSALWICNLEYGWIYQRAPPPKPLISFTAMLFSLSQRRHATPRKIGTAFQHNERISWFQKPFPSKKNTPTGCKCWPLLRNTTLRRLNVPRHYNNRLSGGQRFHPETRWTQSKINITTLSSSQRHQQLKCGTEVIQNVRCSHCVPCTQVFPCF